MSWTVSTTLKHENTAAGWQQDLNALNALAVSGNEQCTDERADQVDAAIRAVFQILTENVPFADDRTKALFANADEISVSMSGHANKGHSRDESWSNEFIYIHVAVKSYRAKA